MTTQRLSYDWRIPTAGLMLLAILVAGFTLHSHWNAFIQWCLATQITLHRYLVMYLLQLNNHQYSGGLWLLTGAFFTACCTRLARDTANLSLRPISAPTKRANWLPG
jgi:hypothetical protein